ncbi:MAG: YkgJ family cysteine cluster protein [Cyanobacteria bacterium HKST-UBA02]|nr:YkgJ family cysteine cluster protein [Cyanobacteria bacterium HKST-UBA02]
MAKAESVLHIPEGINYECTGCGKCCGGWSVPMTEEDYFRISDVDWAKENEKFIGRSLFRDLKDYESQGTPYTHAIKEGDDGHCPFLVDKLCFIHSKRGAEAKPSICQLFPYCFNETPSGVYATVSFVSMGAVNNSGRALSEQRDYLEKKLAEFRALYPEHEPNWSAIQLSTGIPLSWDAYLEHEKVLIEALSDDSLSFEERFLKGSSYLAGELRKARGGGSQPAPVNLASAPSMKWLDRQLLTALHKIYFPVKKLGRGEGDFNFYRFLYQAVFLGALPTTINVPGYSYNFARLEKLEFPRGDQDIDNLIYRYFFTRIFGKLYFGAGFGQLSLLVGFHHLAFVYALLKLQSKAIALSRDASTVSYLDVVAAVRTLEKRLGETALDGMAAATFELLLFSHTKVARVLAHT